MCREEFQEREDYYEKRNRLDRCYYSSKTLEPISIELLGTKPYYEKEWISDHYGLLTTFKRI